ncbi:hypothetical protein [Nocardia pseudovaccinii]|uniref:hypothetical protein n=1 Tax=Nocardia pseudovaccinii TaxID=189540 RepID=UPI000AFECF38|nr:hypothetical protein [Nocardia pseudovaccinii]
MRIRTVAAAAALVAGAGVTAAITAGSAAAVVPVNVPGAIGLGFNHDETIALSNSPIPGILGIGLLAPATVVHVSPDASLPQENGQVLADMPTIWRDAADAPNGRMVVALVDPAQFGGKTILVAEFR